MTWRNGVVAMAPRDTRPAAYSYIRMSTLEQLKGDSERRQMEQSDHYIADHKLKLVEGNELLRDVGISSLKDIGKSAFTGDHILTGAFGYFLKAVEDGRIKKGSYLLVEALDRLSRQDVNIALEIFLRIINRGIKVVTLMDNERVYEVGAPNLSMDLMYSIMVLGTASEESKKKSSRIRDTWVGKRRNIEVTKL